MNSQIKNLLLALFRIHIALCCDLRQMILQESPICLCSYTKDSVTVLGIREITDIQSFQEYFDLTDDTVDDLQNKEDNLNIIQLRAAFERVCMSGQEIILKQPKITQKKVDYIEQTALCFQDTCLNQLFAMKKQKSTSESFQNQLLICLFQLESNLIIKCLQDVLNQEFPCFFRNCNPLDLLFRCDGISVFEDLYLYKSKCLIQFLKTHHFQTKEDFTDIVQLLEIVQRDLAEFLFQLDLYCDVKLLQYVQCLAGLTGNNNTQDSINQLLEEQVEKFEEQCDCEDLSIKEEEQDGSIQKKHPLQCVDFLVNSLSSTQQQFFIFILFCLFGIILVL